MSPDKFSAFAKGNKPFKVKFSASALSILLKLTQQAAGNLFLVLIRQKPLQKSLKYPDLYCLFLDHEPLRSIVQVHFFDLASSFCLTNKTQGGSIITTRNVFCFCARVGCAYLQDSLLLTGAFHTAYDGCLKVLVFSCSSFAHVHLKSTAKHEQEMQRKIFFLLQKRMTYCSSLLQRTVQSSMPIITSL